MQLIGANAGKDAPVWCGTARVMFDGGLEAVPVEVQTESELCVYVNDVLTMKVICSESYLADLVLGRLFTEGIINGVDEVESIALSEGPLEARVLLHGREADLSRTEVSSVPTCSNSNKLLNAFFDRGEPMRPAPRRQWDPVRVFDAAHDFRRDKTAHARTRGAHSAYLYDLYGTSGLLALREDIGRHNAFDKAIGWALAEGVDLSGCMLYTSGRVPTDMLTKAIRAGLPMLVSKSVPTEEAVEMAREYGITLICGACPRSFDVLSGGELMLPMPRA